MVLDQGQGVARLTSTYTDIKVHGPTNFRLETVRLVQTTVKAPGSFPTFLTQMSSASNASGTCRVGFYSLLLPRASESFNLILGFPYVNCILRKTLRREIATSDNKVP